MQLEIFDGFVLPFNPQWDIIQYINDDSTKDQLSVITTNSVAKLRVESSLKARSPAQITIWLLRSFAYMRSRYDLFVIWPRSLFLDAVHKIDT